MVANRRCNPLEYSVLNDSSTERKPIMQELEMSSTQSLIDRYYQEEKEQRERELSLASLAIRLDASDLAMLNMIAHRFRKTRDQVAQEVLSNALVDLFSRLEPGERKLLARDADEATRAIAHEIAEENGIRPNDVKTGVWTNHDRHFTKLERKKSKVTDTEQHEENVASVSAHVPFAHLHQANVINDDRSFVANEENPADLNTDSNLAAMG